MTLIQHPAGCFPRPESANDPSMSRKKTSKSTQLPSRAAGELPSKREILAFIEGAPGKVGKREIAQAFAIKGEDRIALKMLLGELTADGTLVGNRKAIKQLFDEMHELRYGTSAPQENAEIVSLRATVTGMMRKPPQAKVKRGTATLPKTAFTGKRSVYFGGSFRPAPTYRRAALLAGNRIKGPALIEEHASTTVLMPGDRCEVDAYGNLVIAVGRAR